MRYLYFSGTSPPSASTATDGERGPTPGLRISPLASRRQGGLHPIDGQPGGKYDWGSRKFNCGRAPRSYGDCSAPNS
jgi:hypothetical protein